MNDSPSPRTSSPVSGQCVCCLAHRGRHSEHRSGRKREHTKADLGGWTNRICGREVRTRTTGTYEIAQRPTVRAAVSFLPPPDFQDKTTADFMVLGHIMTTMPNSTRSRRWSPPRRAS
jgi:hypothetical protein